MRRSRRIITSRATTAPGLAARVLRGLVAAVLTAGALSSVGALVSGAPAHAETMRAPLPPELRIDWTRMVVSREDFICLALNDYWEARGQDTRARVAVAQVVLNRTRDPRFPETICGVVTENRSHKPGLCQFSWYCDGRDDTPHEADAWRASVLLAKSVLQRNNAISDLTGGALWYHNRDVDPHWSGRLEFAARVGDHYFYRDVGPRVVPAGTPPQTFADWTEEQARATPGEADDVTGTGTGTTSGGGRQVARSPDR